jgi:hypothetical protein
LIGASNIFAMRPQVKACALKQASLDTLRVQNIAENSSRIVSVQLEMFSSYIVDCSVNEYAVELDDYPVDGGMTDTAVKGMHTYKELKSLNTEGTSHALNQAKRCGSCAHFFSFLMKIICCRMS